MDANDIVIFAAVVKAGSFIGASRALEIPKSTVSRRVSELEKGLGTQLLQRTTRQLSLTDAGRLFHAHAERIVSEMDSARESVGTLQVEPRGKLRVTVPVNFDRLTITVASLMHACPKLELELLCTDRVVNLVEEGFDLAVRAGSLQDSSLIARRVGALQSILVASPKFLSEHQPPAAPADLAELSCLVFGSVRNGERWTLVREGKRTSVDVCARLLVNDFRFVHAACIAGLGIASMAERDCRDDLEAGSLVHVLPEWRPPSVPVHAVYPSTRFLAPKTAAFIEHLVRNDLR